MIQRSNIVNLISLLQQRKLVANNFLSTKKLREKIKLRREDKKLWNEILRACMEIEKMQDMLDWPDIFDLASIAVKCGNVSAQEILFKIFALFEIQIGD